MSAALSIVALLAAGVAEIDGGYLVWLWLREGKPVWVGALGACVLVIYGIIPTVQPASFGRVYAAYGGIFVALSVLWGWRIDGLRPERPEIVGATYLAPRDSNRHVLAAALSCILTRQSSFCSSAVITLIALLCRLRMPSSEGQAERVLQRALSPRTPCISRWRRCIGAAIVRLEEPVIAPAA